MVLIQIYICQDFCVLSPFICCQVLLKLLKLKFCPPDYAEKKYFVPELANSPSCSVPVRDIAYGMNGIKKIYIFQMLYFIVDEKNCIENINIPFSLYWVCT